MTARSSCPRRTWPRSSPTRATTSSWACTAMRPSPRRASSTTTVSPRAPNARTCCPTSWPPRSPRRRPSPSRPIPPRARLIPTRPRVTRAPSPNCPRAPLPARWASSPAAPPRRPWRPRAAALPRRGPRPARPPKAGAPPPQPLPPALTPVLSGLSALESFGLGGGAMETASLRGVPSDMKSLTVVRRENGSTWVELLRGRALEQPARRVFTLLEDGETEAGHWDFAELDRRARAIAATPQWQTRAGERALLLYPFGLDFVAAFHGGAGSPPSPPPPRTGARGAAG